MDIHTSFDSNYFSKPKFPNDQIRLIVNETEQESIGIMYVSLVNFSTKELIDLPVNIILEPQNLGDFEVLAYSAVGEDENPELVEETKKMVFDKGIYRFSYKAKAINRIDEPDYGFQLRILFEGEEEPVVKVSTVGIDTREYDANNKPSSTKDTIKNTSLYILGMVFFIVLVVIFTGLFVLPVVSLLSHKSDVKFRKKRAAKLYKVIKSNALNPELDDEQLKEYVTELLYQERLQFWKSSSVIVKWTSAMIPPNKEEHRPAI
ncbi:hypothetical protein QFW85_09215 [Vibrio chagasii]|uniref:hypothetical protein n=1 Tax=Vibrio chagasii TaxID=170679 RepID=UPI003DA9E2C3